MHGKKRRLDYIEKVAKAYDSLPNGAISSTILSNTTKYQDRINRLRQKRIEQILLKQQKAKDVEYFDESSSSSPSSHLSSNRFNTTYLAYILYPIMLPELMSDTFVILHQMLLYLLMYK